MPRPAHSRSSERGFDHPIDRFVTPEEFKDTLAQIGMEIRFRCHGYCLRGYTARPEHGNLVVAALLPRISKVGLRNVSDSDCRGISDMDWSAVCAGKA